MEKERERDCEGDNLRSLIGLESISLSGAYYNIYTYIISNTIKKNTFCFLLKRWWWLQSGKYAAKRKAPSQT